MQMTALNVWRNPCVDDADYTIENCQLECFSEIIVRFANCCLPFMRLTRTTDPNNYDTCVLCNTPDDYQKADVALQRILNGTTPWVILLERVTYFFFEEFFFIRIWTDQSRTIF